MRQESAARWSTGDRRGGSTRLVALLVGVLLILANFFMLWLQAFDNQSGISVPFSRLDYHVVVQWLGRVLALDPRGQYPLLSAARVYAGVPSPDQKITMFEFVYQSFLDDPNRRWPWRASCCRRRRAPRGRNW